MPYTDLPLKIVSNEIIAKNIYLVKASAGKNIDFKAGQYFSIKIADRINRPYSVASAPNNDLIEFLVDVTPQGPGSLYIQDLKIDQEIRVMGPFGFFTLEKYGIENSQSPIILIATGTGVAPFKSIVIDQLKNKNSKRDIYLYFGLRFDTEKYYHEDFQELAKEYSTFKFIPVISRPSDAWSGEVGHCQNIIKKIPIIKDAKIFICGVTSNVMSIAEDLMEYGYEKESIIYEKYG